MTLHLLTRAALFCVLGAASVAPAAGGPVAQAFHAYATAEAEAISRLVPRRYLESTSLRQVRSEVDALIADTPRGLHRQLAVFLIELAEYDLRGFSNDAWRETLEPARELVTGRSTSPGANVGDDAFEMAWHKTSVALLSGLRSPERLNGRVPFPAGSSTSSPT